MDLEEEVHSRSGGHSGPCWTPRTSRSCGQGREPGIVVIGFGGDSCLKLPLLV